MIGNAPLLLRGAGQHKGAGAQRLNFQEVSWSSVRRWPPQCDGVNGCLLIDLGVRIVGQAAAKRRLDPRIVLPVAVVSSS